MFQKEYPPSVLTMRFFYPYAFLAVQIINFSLDILSTNCGFFFYQQNTNF